MADDISKEATGRFLDNPDGVRTTKESLFDMHEDMQTVDALPVEDINIEFLDEKDHHHTKNRSLSEERYPK
ncbi:hypothetical protein [Psychrobacillus sp. BM2]|uniref:hypothetical protein n=1 Tax=Psychrobacillus sp. BM2 TaxID=3400421 RepID=UPI003B027648